MASSWALLDVPGEKDDKDGSVASVRFSEARPAPTAKVISPRTSQNTESPRPGLLIRLFWSVGGKIPAFCPGGAQVVAALGALCGFGPLAEL